MTAAISGSGENTYTYSTATTTSSVSFWVTTSIGKDGTICTTFFEEAWSLPDIETLFEDET